MFLRIKRVRGRPYAYLVENRWDASQGQSRQRVLSYLGRLDQVRPEQIPGEYRSRDVLEALARQREAEKQKVQVAADRLRTDLTDVLVRGDVTRTRAVARAAIRELGDEEFLHGVLSETMRDLGRRW